MSSSGSKSEFSSSKSGMIIGCIVAGIVGCFLLLFIAFRRKNISTWLRGNWTSAPAPVDSDTEAAREPLTTEIRAEPVQTAGSSPSQGARRYRYNQRQDSGLSIRSIPAYTSVPRDEELVLMRPRESQDISEGTQMAPIVEGSELSRVATDISDDSSNNDNSINQYSINNSSTLSVPLLQPPDYVYRSQSRSTSSTDLANTTEISLNARRLSADDLSLASSRQSMEFGRPRSGTTASDMSIASSNLRGANFRDSLGIKSKPPSSKHFWKIPKQHRPNSSTSSLVISEPLRDTLSQSSSAYVYPKAGLTPEQVEFISSRESLRLVAQFTDNQPPAFEQLPESFSYYSTSRRSTPPLDSSPPSPTSIHFSEANRLSLALPEPDEEVLTDTAIDTQDHRISRASFDSFESAHSEASHATYTTAR